MNSVPDWSFSFAVREGHHVPCIVPSDLRKQGMCTKYTSSASDFSPSNEEGKTGSPKLNSMRAGHLDTETSRYRDVSYRRRAEGGDAEAPATATPRTRLASQS